MGKLMKLNKTLYPFYFIKSKGRFSLSFGGEDLKSYLFLKLGFNDSGYSWEKVAKYYILNFMRDSIFDFNFDCELDTFCIFSKNYKILRKFALEFKKLWDNDILLLDFIPKALTHNCLNSTLMKIPAKAGMGVSNPALLNSQDKIIP